MILLTVPQAAHELSVSPSTIRRLIDPAISLENGDILHVTWGSDGTHTERVERAESTVRRTVNDRKVGGDDRDRTDA